MAQRLTRNDWHAVQGRSQHLLQGVPLPPRLTLLMLLLLQPAGFFWVRFLFFGALGLLGVLGLLKF